MGNGCGKDFVEIQDTCVYRDSINPGAPGNNHRGNDRAGVVRSESGGLHLLEVEVDAGKSSSSEGGTQEESFWQSIWPLLIGVAAVALIYYFISARRHRRQMRRLREMDRRDPERGGAGVFPMGPVHWAPPVWQGPLPGAPPQAVIIEPPQQQQQPQQLVPPRVPQP
jgi:hypothetical protein